MHRTALLHLALALAMALPVAGQAAGCLDQACEEMEAGNADCCSSAPSAGDCPATDCAGWSSAVPVSSACAGLAARLSDAPESSLARFLAPPARAPDTAPPKSVA